MKINILLPYKEKFDENKASAVSITVKNSLFKKNFQGIKHSFFTLKNKNVYLAQQMLRIILKCDYKKQLIEIHNRPYLVNVITKK